MKARGGYIYIVSNKTRSTVYTGVSSNLYARIYQHKYENGSYFTNKYNCIDLIYYQFFSDIETAIRREKKVKKWNRAWKDKLIRDFNPTLRVLFDEVKDMQ
ncbi:MAG: GIY-YIG nuclease family protein [Cyclobacteriaceae bacterium]